MINGKLKQESLWRNSIWSISWSAQVLVVFERRYSQSIVFRSWACLRNSIWGEELRSCCTIRRRETSMVVPVDLHSQQKVILWIYSNVGIHLSLLLRSLLQRDLYNLLVHEDAQQVLLTPDPSLYKYAVHFSLSLFPALDHSRLINKTDFPWRTQTVIFWLIIHRTIPLRLRSPFVVQRSRNSSNT